MATADCRAALSRIRLSSIHVFTMKPWKVGLAQVTANAPLAVQASKRLALGIVEGQIVSEQERWAATAAEGLALMRTQDAKEGPLAFAEKRAPVWRAR